MIGLSGRLLSGLSKPTEDVLRAASPVIKIKRKIMYILCFDIKITVYLVQQ